ncbi:hypothetical protein [Carnobacterium pleistocenium]|uniref:hypothetical protein n=1 Tax=Carnobacterium pleistocenium TaxID=181073 RepID=UPI0005508553|nr:hypothetical protein [Carnobacterium pleistocenium]
MDDSINENFKKLALIQKYRNKELKEAVYPIKPWLTFRRLKTQEEIQEAVTAINRNYDEAAKTIYKDLNKDLESNGLQTYKKGE